jgi:tetratricopeptide (TPR) repeat protein
MLGNILVNQNRFAEAPALREALRLQPDAFTHGKGGCCAGFDGAIRHAETARRPSDARFSQPKRSAGARNGRGHCPAERSGSSDAALADLDRPDQAYLKGDLLLQRGLRKLWAVSGGVVRPATLPLCCCGKLAWIRRPSRPGVGDGHEAVRLAEQAAAATRNQDPTILDILAAAYAEAGRFEEAVASVQRALALITDASKSAELRNRLGLYQSRRSYRLSP